MQTAKPTRASAGRPAPPGPACPVPALWSLSVPGPSPQVGGAQTHEWVEDSHTRMLGSWGTLVVDGALGPLARRGGGGWAWVCFLSVAGASALPEGPQDQWLQGLPCDRGLKGSLDTKKLPAARHHQDRWRETETKQVRTFPRRPPV